MIEHLYLVIYESCKSVEFGGIINIKKEQFKENWCKEDPWQFVNLIKGHSSSEFLRKFKTQTPLIPENNEKN